MSTHNRKSNLVRLLILILALLFATSLIVGFIGCDTKTKDEKTNQRNEKDEDDWDWDEEEDDSDQNGIPWQEAKYHYGEIATVYGPVVSTKWATESNGQPTFLNIGNPHPDPNRFTVVIWVQYRPNFPFAPESFYLGKTIYVTGLIQEYKGGPQIHATSPSEIQE